MQTETGREPGGDQNRGAGRALRRIGARATLLAAGVSLTVAAPALAASCPTPPHTTANFDVRMGLIVAAALTLGLLAILLAAAKVLETNFRGLFVGMDGRLSTSKTIPTLWTLVVADMLLALVYASLQNHPCPLLGTDGSGTIGQYAVLFGGPLGAAILAKQIVTTQVANNPAVKPKATDGARLGDLVAGDAGAVDLGDLQYVAFNVVAFVYVIGTFYHGPSVGMPHIPDVLLGLTSVSAVGFVGKKALTPTGLAGATLDPPSGWGGTRVTIALTGLDVPAPDRTPLWVLFGDTWAEPIAVARLRDGSGQVTVSAPSVTGEGTATAVTLITGQGTVVSAGTFTYTTAPAPAEQALAPSGANGAGVSA